MAIVDEQKLYAIGDAIRTKTGEQSGLTLDEMKTEISGISTESDIVTYSNYAEMTVMASYNEEEI